MVGKDEVVSVCVCVSEKERVAVRGWGFLKGRKGREGNSPHS